MNHRREVGIAIKAFIKERINNIYVYILFCSIFIILFNLQNVSADVVLYAAEICAFLAFIFWSVEFFFFYKNHIKLLEVKNNISITSESLPDAKTLIEKNYQEIIMNLYDTSRKNESDFLRKNKEMQDYYTLWAHQIKTPITALSLMLQSEQNPEALHKKQELFKIEQYVDLVMEYLRMGSMNSDLILEKHDLEKVVKISIKKYASVFYYKEISLELSQIKAKVITDEKWLSFVIGQIISNSLKYTSKGVIKIYLSEEYSKTLVIEDTGIGINEEDIPRVFEQGFTGYNGRMDKKASGLGLYLCKNVIKNLGHKIWIESILGKGTKVFIDLHSENLEVE